MTESPDVCSDYDLNEGSLLWVDKYKPTSIKQIIGQQGDKSNAKKLLNWLTHWHKNLGKKPVCKFKSKNLHFELIIIILTSTFFQD